MIQYSEVSDENKGLIFKLVKHHPGPSLAFSSPTTLAKSQITPSSRSNLMHPRPLLPTRTPPLDDGDNLLGHPSGKHSLSARAALALAGRVEDPRHGLTTALTESEGHGDLEGDSAAGGAALGADAEEGGDGVEGEG